MLRGLLFTCFGGVCSRNDFSRSNGECLILEHRIAAQVVTLDSDAPSEREQ